MTDARAVHTSSISSTYFVIRHRTGRNATRLSRKILVADTGTSSLAYAVIIAVVFTMNLTTRFALPAGVTSTYSLGACSVIVTIVLASLLAAINSGVSRKAVAHSLYALTLSTTSCKKKKWGVSPGLFSLKFFFQNSVLLSYNSIESNH